MFQWPRTIQRERGHKADIAALEHLDRWVQVEPVQVCSVYLSTTQHVLYKTCPKVSIEKVRCTFTLAAIFLTCSSVRLVSFRTARRVHTLTVSLVFHRGETLAPTPF